MTLESSKTLGGVGAILLLIGVLPYVISFTFGILALVGIILILIALYGFSTIYNEKSIFNNSLYGFIAGIVGVVVAAAVALIAVLSNLTNLLQKIYPSWDGKLSSLSSIQGMTPQTSNLNFSDIVPLLEGLVAVFVILWIFIVIWAFFARKSLKTLSTKSGVGLFSTAALLLIIGAALTIVIVGVVVLWVAVLLMAVAFFQMKTQAAQPNVTYVAPPSTPTPV